MTSWLDPTPAPDVRGLTLVELLALWTKSRNSLLGVICAEEVCRRLAREKL